MGSGARQAAGAREGAHARGAPIERLLAYRRRMGWSFQWASSHDSDFNLDYGVSAEDGVADGLAVAPFEANELALLTLLHEQPAVRENLPLIATETASATGTNLEGYSPRDTASARSRARATPSTTATPATLAARSS